MGSRSSTETDLLQRKVGRPVTSSLTFGLQLLFLGLLLTSCDRETQPGAVGTLERDRIELIAEVREPIVAIPVTEGDQVAVGDLLVELDDRRLAAQLAARMAARDRAAATLAELVRGTRNEEIREARARLHEAEAAIAQAAPELQRARSLVAAEVEAQRRLDEAEAVYQGAVARRGAARATLDRLVEGPTAEQLDQVRAQVAESEAAITAGRLDLDRTRIVASRAGRIDALPYEVGEQPPAGGVVAVLLAGELPYARVYVPAHLRPRVRPGTAATVRVDGFEAPFAGRVRTVAGEASFTPFFALTERDRGRLSYLAEVDLTDQAAGELASGLPVEVEFVAE